MSAYFVVELEITNPAAIQPYRDAVGATIEQYGGRFLARAGTTELIEAGPSRNASSSWNLRIKRRSSAGTIHLSTRKSCPAGSTTPPHAPSSSRA